MRSVSRLLPAAAALLLLPLDSRPAWAQEEVDSLWTREHYVKREVRIPMRDGVRLFTAVYLPKDSSARHPIVLRRTPYRVPPYGEERFITPGGALLDFMRTGWIVVFQDVRGRGMSEGTW